jgi:hypothetical protein
VTLTDALSVTGAIPATTRKNKAHRAIPRTLKTAAGPKMFYPDPGSLTVVENTCGVCHPGYLQKTEKSLMQTEAGKIQGNLSSWGDL